MTTIAGGHFMPTAPQPRSGILLNASPASSAPNSPKRSSFLSPCLSGPTALGLHQTPVSSHSSTSSTASSTDDIVSSTSATSAAGTHVSSSSVTAHYSQRKIRFAPLPEPRRDEYDDEELLSPGFFETDSAAASPNLAAQMLLSPPLSPNVLPPTPLHSPNLNGSHGQASCSTLGLSLDGVELPDSGQATETNTVAGSECGTDDTHTNLNLKKKSTRWTRLIPFGKPPSSKSGTRTPDEHQFSLCRSPSRESTASGYSLRSVTGLGRLLGSVSDNASSASLGHPISRRKTGNGSDSVPVSPTVSFQGGHSLKPVVSESGTAATAVPRRKGHAQTNSTPNVRRGTRLLNGRVYGRRPQSAGGAPKNLFANIRDDEPEFVEWGHGGMGSVRTADLGSSQWARLQSDKKLSIGHDDGDGTVGGDEDDGGGMTWVKRRREARERERREREEREAREKAEREKSAGDGEIKSQAEDSVTEVAADKGDVERADAAVEKTELESIANDANEKEIRDAPSDEKQPVDEETETKEETESKKDKAHVYTAVTIPASRPLQPHSRQNSLNASRLPSPTRTAVHTPTRNTPTTETPPVHHMFFATSPLGSPGATIAALGPSPLSLGQKPAEETTSSPGSSASSSYEEDSPLGDKDSEKDDVDEEDEEEANEQARKTAIGAGVEKVSRHKE